MNIHNVPYIFVFVELYLFLDLLIIYVFLELPYNDYFEYYGPDFKLNLSPSNMANQNTGEYLDKIKYVFISYYMYYDK